MARVETNQQLAFQISSENSLFVPQQLQSFPFGKEIVSFLEQRDFKDKNIAKHNLVFFPNIGKDDSIEINPYNFQIIKKNTGLVRNPMFGSAVVLIDKNISEFTEDTLVEKFKYIKDTILYSSPVFIFSTNFEDGDKKIIRNCLKKSELVVGKLFFKRNVSKDLNVWETRKEKKTKRVTINLLSLNEYGKPKYRWAFYMFERLVELYEDYGCYIVKPKDSELYQSLISCRNVRLAYENLTDGNGIKYIMSCGCEYKKSLNGSLSQLKDCGQSAHGGSFERINWTEQMIKDICAKKIEKNLTCDECGEFLERHGSCKKIYADGSVSVLFNTYCPHCGGGVEQDYRKKTIYFKREDLKEEWYKVIEGGLKES